MKNKLLEKTFQALEAIALSHKPITLKELSGRLDLNISTLSRIAADLIEAGFVAKSGYRHFEPALGLIRLGQNAMNSSILPRTINPLIKARAEALGVNGAFAGMEHGQLVYLYRGDAFSEEQKIGLPWHVPLFRSNIAITILGRSTSKEEALAMLGRSVKEEDYDNSPKADMNEIEELLDHVTKNGYLMRREPLNRWNICFPVEYGGRCYGVSFYGDRADERNFDRLLFECSLLASRIQSQLTQL